MSLRSVSQTVRVDIRKLDRLMTIVGELAIVKTAIARLAERARSRGRRAARAGDELARLNRTFDRHLAQMQSGILEVRMVPLGQAFDKLARVVRQISREHGKEVNLVVTGAETEIDKLIVEELSDPLMHMIRNAIDHGIEPRDERLRVGKPPVGTIALNAFQKGNHVVIEVEDDGAGMDPKALLAAAVRRGRRLGVRGAGADAPREVLALVFMPGFTTKEVATDLSGRGVGLDVVKTNIAQARRRRRHRERRRHRHEDDDHAADHAGDHQRACSSRSARSLFAIPLASVEEAIALDRAQRPDRRVARGADACAARRCRSAGSIGSSGCVRAATARSRAFVVIAQVADRRLGFVVDELVGQRDIVIKALGKSLKSVRGFAGATELGDQRVALVLDVAVAHRRGALARRGSIPRGCRRGGRS